MRLGPQRRRRCSGRWPICRGRWSCSPPVLWTDDTPVTVLGGEKPGSTKGRFWAYIGDDEHPYSVYDFTMSRARDGPAAFLRTTAGSSRPMPMGATTGSSSAPNGTIVEVACWAHARRKFYDARSNAPREANQVLEWIRQLYDMEDRARGADGRGAAGAAAAGVGADPRSDRGVPGRAVAAGLAQVVRWARR